MWGDKLIGLPAGLQILTADVRRGMDGENFKVFDQNGKKREIEGIPPAVAGHYFRVERYCHSFGLPHGRGWHGEQPWLLDFMVRMKTARIEIENWNIERRAPHGGDQIKNSVQF